MHALCLHASGHAVGAFAGRRRKRRRRHLARAGCASARQASVHSPTGFVLKCVTE